MKLTTRRALVGTALAASVAGGSVVAQRSCGASECDKLKATVEALCGAAPGSQACHQAQSQYEALCAAPAPTPSPTTTPGPTPIPAPGHVCVVGTEYCQCWFMSPGTDVWLEAKCPEGQTCAPDRRSCVPGAPPACPATCPEGQACTDPAVGCVVIPEPPAGSCPWKLSQYPGVHLEANTKYWGQGLDHTTLVVGSSRYCADRGWTDGRASCQVAIDGDPNKVTCEVEFGGGCPRFEFRQNGVQHPCVDDQADLMSCDHLGSTTTRDDPQTPTTGNTLATLRGFEGEPKVCGLQRIGDKPIAGFFTIAHGFGGEARSCVDSSFSACGPWLAVNH